MIERLFQMQARIHTMREALLKEGSVVPSKNKSITFPEVKIDVLWYLDRLAAAVTGAHWHMNTVEHDHFLSATDKVWMQRNIVERLPRDLGWLPGLVNDLDFQEVGYQEMDFMEVEANKSQPPLTGHTRENVIKERNIVSETLDQLSTVEDEVADMLQMLGADMA